MMAAHLNRQRDTFNGEFYYKDTRTGAEFRRLVGGLAWPFDAAHGAVIVLGESRNPDFHIKDRHHVTLVAEAIEGDIKKLLEMAHRMQLDVFCKDWITPRESYYMEFLHDFNDEKEALRQPTIYAYSPPQWDRQECLRFYMRLLERRVKSEKTLHFGDKSLVRDHCVALARTTEEHHRRLEEFPAAAAILYALAELDLRPYGKTVDGKYQAGDKLAGY